MTVGPTADPRDDESPFRPPESVSSERTSSGADQSVFAEPWMAAVIHAGNPHDSAGLDASLPPDPDAEHSVWDEPGRSSMLTGDVPENAVTWFSRFRSMCQTTSVMTTWLVTLAVTAVAGPFAIIGTLLQGATGSGLLMVVAIGPTIEEVMKVAVPVWIVEKRPWLYRSPFQILFCCFASGLAFAAVENVVYLNIYIENPSLGLAQWRWTVCMLLHASCSLIAGAGVSIMWKRFQQKQTPPDVSDAAAAILTAVTVHGVYNAAVTVLEVGGLTF